MRNNQTKKKETKKKPLHDMTLLDNFLFREAMNVPELFGILVDICMEKHVVFNGKPHVEKVFSAQPDLREIRVDVYSESVHEAVYSIEMQKDNTKNLQKRSRYYQAHVDVQLLEPGERDFNKMKDIYLIMICPFDLFGKGACRYTFHEVCEEYPDLKLKDGGHRMFINTKGTNRSEFSTEFLELLNYINAPVDELEKYTTTERMKQLHEGIQKLKRSREVHDKYMFWWEEVEQYKDEARAEGLEEGRREGRREGKREGESIGEVRGKAAQIVEMGLEFGLSADEILSRLQQKLSISSGEAEEYFRMYSSQQT